MCCIIEMRGTHAGSPWQSWGYPMPVPGRRRRRPEPNCLLRPTRQASTCPPCAQHAAAPPCLKQCVQCASWVHANKWWLHARGKEGTQSKHAPKGGGGAAPAPTASDGTANPGQCGAQQLLAHGMHTSSNATALGRWGSSPAPRHVHTCGRTARPAWHHVMRLSSRAKSVPQSGSRHLVQGGSDRCLQTELAEVAGHAQAAGKAAASPASPLPRRPEISGLASDPPTPPIFDCDT